MTLAVIGAGFGRTGTLSLKLSLEELGFGPCCHGSEAHHFQQDPNFWECIFKREFNDWDTYFHGYRSTIDSPSCKLYAELAAHYPWSKVVLTLRDPLDWICSYEETILPMMASPLGRKHFSFLFGTDRPDRALMIAGYERHNREVQQQIPSDRLLVYDVKSGWPPLCDFLNVPVPDTPFPNTNPRADFSSVIDEMLSQLK